MSLIDSLFRKFPLRGEIAIWKKGQGCAFFTPEELDDVVKYYNAEQADWYFHLATHDPSKINNRGSIKSAQQFTCFWADIDLATKDDEKYPTEKEVEALFTLLDNEEAFPSCVVRSGMGYHAYWFLDKPYESDEYPSVVKAWLSYLQEKITELVPDRKVKIDQVGDMSRVLRLPGTRHHVAGKVVSEVWCQDERRYTLEQLAVRTNYYDRKETGTGKIAVKNQLLANMGAIHTHVPSYIENIAHRCGQVREFFELKGQVEEPIWYAMGGLFSYAEDGMGYYLNLSAAADPYMDSDRSEAGTLAKIEQWNSSSSGPATCNKFNDLNYGICQNCPQFNHITTPLQLGYSKPIIVDTESHNPFDKVEGVEFEEDQFITEFVPPYPYLIDENQNLCIEMPKNKKEKEIKVLCHNIVTPFKRIWDELEQEEVIYYRIATENDGWRMCSILLSTLQGSCPALSKLMGYGALVNNQFSSLMANYLIQCVRYMQELKSVNQSYSKIGWRGEDKDQDDVDNDDRFVFGNMTFYRKGPNKLESLTEGLTSSLKDLGVKGDIDEWIKATSVFGRPGMEAHMLCFFGSFAVPLLRATEYSGMLINLVSRDSGTFKSFTLKMITSIYGEPTFKHLLTRDSPKSVMKKISHRCDLPIVFDEITNITQDELSDFTYALTQGREQDRLNQDASLRANDSNWRTICFSTSNASLDDVLGEGHIAERMRLLELSVQDCYTNPPITDVEAIEAMRKVSENYGMAGAIWLNYIAKNRDVVFAQAREAVEGLSISVDSNGDKRFWVSFIALAMMAASITKSLGLHGFDVSKLVAYCKELLDVSESKIKADKVPLATYISVFINENISSLQSVVYDNLNRTGNITIDPLNKVVARFETHNKTLNEKNKTAFISVKAMKELLVSHRVSYNEFIATLKINDILLKETVHKKIPLKDNAGGTTMRAFSIDMNRYIQEYGEPNDIIT